ncbi:MAG: hypothetical protein ACLGG7_09440 [Bacteriovoracia bacterium]
MKKQLVLAAGLAVLATPAFASKARLLALGEDVDGSFYIQDNRNIFLNASEINNNKDFVTYELAAGDNEGGFARTAGNMVYGVHLGRTLDYNANVQTLGTDAAAGLNVYDATNAIDLFLGGDAGVKWGVQLTYSSQKDDAYASGANVNGATTTEANTDVIDLSVGIGQGAWNAYAKAGIVGTTEHKDQDAEVKRASDIEVGGSYNVNGYVVYGQYGMAAYEIDGGAELEKSMLNLGVARQEKLNDKAVMFTKLNYGMDTSELKKANTPNETNTNDLTATIGLEFDAASWLTLRGSVGQAVLVNETEVKPDKSTQPNTTIVAAGASLKFGDMTVDGMVGNTTGANAPAGAGTIDSSNLMTRVSMTYRF